MSEAKPIQCAALVLAAGKGTRMQSRRPKALQTLLGAPMLAYALAALEPIFGKKILVVAGHGADFLVEAFPETRFVIQKDQLGTGHAVLSALPEIENEESALVINADAPLVTTALLEKFLSLSQGADLSFASIKLNDPGAYGRVTRDASNKIKAIVEAKDFDPAKHGPLTGEINAGLYFLRMAPLKMLLPLLRNDNKSGEYYLTDLVGLALEHGYDVRGVDCGEDASLLGINSPLELARMEDMLAVRTSMRLLDSGVIIHAPGMLRASPFASISPGVEIFCPCEIYGRSTIETGAVIESHCVIRDSHIGENALVRQFSHLEGAALLNGAQAGPYARLRPGARLQENSHVGNFVELKKTSLGRGSKANHLSYLGDSEIGENVNIGAGTITCNYDGRNKHQTIIGDSSFIGSNTALVAPVKIGANALVGAGSVITRDVPDNELAIARERQKNLPRKKRGQ